MSNHIPHAKRLFRASVCFAAAVAFVFSATPAFAISRDVVVKRGLAWVKLNVPYSQKRYATTDGSLIPTSVSTATTSSPVPGTPGWRTDCSGFVSMCLGLQDWKGDPLPLNTTGLSGSKWTHKITKAELKPGDMILKPGTHVVLFVRWANAKKTRYVCYQERGTAYGTVATEVTYPYGADYNYKPYRYNGISDGKLRRSLSWFAPLSMSGF